MSKVVLIGLLSIVVISMFAVVAHDSITGAISGSVAGGSYGVSKVYGGGIKKQSALNSYSAEGAKQIYYDGLLEYMALYPEKLTCGFGEEALSSEKACVLDEKTGKYCCII